MNKYVFIALPVIICNLALLTLMLVRGEMKPEYGTAPCTKALALSGADLTLDRGVNYDPMSLCRPKEL